MSELEPVGAAFTRMDERRKREVLRFMESVAKDFPAPPKPHLKPVHSTTQERGST